MITGSLAELIVERRFGPLRVGQELADARSALGFVPDLEARRQSTDHGGLFWYDFSSLEVVLALEERGSFRVKYLFVKPNRIELEAERPLFQLDWNGLDKPQPLTRHLLVLEPFGVRFEVRIDAFFSYVVGASTRANFYLDDEDDESGDAVLYSLEVG